MTSSSSLVVGPGHSALCPHVSEPSGTEAVPSATSPNHLGTHPRADANPDVVGRAGGCCRGRGRLGGHWADRGESGRLQ